MALLSRFASDLRRFAPTALIVPALILASNAGCCHKRTAMRPVMVTPPPTLVPAPVPTSGCASGDCASTGARLAPGFSDGTELTSPPASVTPGNGTSPLPAPAGAAPGPGSGEGDVELKPASGTSNGPPLNAPLGRRTDKTTASRRQSPRERVEPFVNDPADLFQPPKADRNWRYIVLHHSGKHTGGYAQVDRDDKKNLGTQGSGYHFVIGNGTESPDGSIEVASRWSEQKAGAHARDARTSEVNDYGIGICVVGDFDEDRPSPRQIEATRALVAYLSDRYRIPADHIGTHADFAKLANACPGRYFPTNEILGDRKFSSQPAARVRTTSRRFRFF